MKRHPLKVVSFNIGNASINDARRIVADERPAALALQEASDQRELVRRICAEFGYLPNQPDDQPGQAATPLLHDPLQLRAVRAICELMAPSQDVGRGTGPDHMKPKWLIGDFFVHLGSGRHVALASTHRVAGNAHGKREEVATEHARNVAAFFRRHRSISAVMGDWNSRAWVNSLKPLSDHGWTSDQLGHFVPTHGLHWAPDHVWWRERWQNGKRDDRIRYVGHHTIGGTGSDHRPLVVDFELTERVR